MSSSKADLPVDKPAGNQETEPGLVFVTVGTTSFDALVAEVDSSACHHALSCVGFSRLIIQKGRGKYTPDKAGAFPHRGVEFHFPCHVHALTYGLPLSLAAPRFSPCAVSNSQSHTMRCFTSPRIHPCIPSPFTTAHSFSSLPPSNPPPPQSLPSPPRLPTEWLDFTPSLAPLIQRASLIISHAGAKKSCTGHFEGRCVGLCACRFVGVNFGLAHCEIQATVYARGLAGVSVSRCTKV